MMELLVSSALGPRSSLPSFFELFMTQQIQLSLKPAAAHAASVLARPALSEWFDEIFALVSFFVERSCLASNGCLLAESFYGLQRAKLARSGCSYEAAEAEMECVGKGHERWALLAAVLLPYLKSKADKLNDRLLRRGRASEEAEDQQHRRRVQRVFVMLYPILHASYEASFLLYQCMYLLRLSPFFSPVLHALGQVVRRSSSMVSSSSRSGGGGGGGGMGEGGLRDKAKRYGQAGLVSAIVLFKVMEWWTTADAVQGTLRRSRSTPVPAPAAGETAPYRADLCPLCVQPRTNATLCKVSGHVFCYRCINAHLHKHGRCPVTGTRSGRQDLLKLFDEG